MKKKNLKSYKKRLKKNRLFLFSKNFKQYKKYVKDNLKAFAKEQSREVKELLQGRQTIIKFFSDTSTLFQEYFIPTNSNDNRPKILRPRQLTIIAFLLIFLKVALVGYVFSIYQERAEMSTDTVNQILILTNESRVMNGSNPLRLNEHLNQAAQAKAEDMMIKNYFAHTSPDGRRPWNFINRSVFPYLLVGENLAMHFISSNDAHAALMASPGHKKNILNPKYTDVGLYVLDGKMNGLETKILVQMFAYRILPEIVETETKPLLVEKSQSIASTPLIEEREELEVQAPEKIVQSEAETEVLGNEQDVNTNEAEKVEIDSEELVASNEELIVTDNVLESSLEEEIIASESLEEEIDATLVATSTRAEIESEYILTQTQSEPVVITRQDSGLDRAAKAMSISKLIYTGLLVVLIFLLVINIVVRVTVQHKSIIMHTVLLLILVSALLLFDFSFMKTIQNASTNITLF